MLSRFFIRPSAALSLTIHWTFRRLVKRASRLSASPLILSRNHRPTIMSLDLERHLIFYGAYHYNPLNVAIHVVCVPLILVSGFCMATYTGMLIHTPSWLTVPYLDLNLGTISAYAYAALYVLLEHVAGFVLAAFCIGTTAFANRLRAEDPQTTLHAALIIHIVSWIAQFVGHGVFEGRDPALLDKLVQAIFLAPMFVWLEVLFKLGYRRELQNRVEKGVAEEIAKFKEQSKHGKAQ